MAKPKKDGQYNLEGVSRFVNDVLFNQEAPAPDKQATIAAAKALQAVFTELDSKGELLCKEFLADKFGLKLPTLKQRRLMPSFSVSESEAQEFEERGCGVYFLGVVYQDIHGWNVSNSAYLAVMAYLNDEIDKPKALEIVARFWNYSQASHKNTYDYFNKLMPVALKQFENDKKTFKLHVFNEDYKVYPEFEIDKKALDVFLNRVIEEDERINRIKEIYQLPSDRAAREQLKKIADEWLKKRRGNN